MDFYSDISASSSDLVMDLYDEFDLSGGGSIPPDISQGISLSVSTEVSTGDNVPVYTTPAATTTSIVTGAHSVLPPVSTYPGLRFGNFRPAGLTTPIQSATYFTAPASQPGPSAFGPRMPFNPGMVGYHGLPQMDVQTLLASRAQLDHNLALMVSRYLYSRVSNTWGVEITLCIAYYMLCLIDVAMIC